MPDIAPMAHDASLETDGNVVKSLDGRCFQPNLPVSDPHQRSYFDHLLGPQSPAGPQPSSMDDVAFVQTSNPSCVSPNTGPEACVSQDPRVDCGSLSTCMQPGIYSHAPSSVPMEDWNINVYGLPPPHDDRTEPKVLLKVKPSKCGLGFRAESSCFLKLSAWTRV